MISCDDVIEYEMKMSINKLSWSCSGYQQCHAKVQPATVGGSLQEGGWECRVALVRQFSI